MQARDVNFPGGQIACFDVLVAGNCVLVALQSPMVMPIHQNMVRELTTETLGESVVDEHLEWAHCRN